MSGSPPSLKLSEVASTVVHMADNDTTALILAALEVLPAEPSDLTGILTSPEQRAALMARTPDDRSTDLTAWLCHEIDNGRVELWHKRLESLHNDLTIEQFTADDQHYPRRLATCWDRPPLLFVRGHIRQTETAVAIVGSRTADQASREVARELSNALVADGAAIVSGLAAGIDTAAHQGALDAGGYTVAVLGTGIRHTFPTENTALAERIAETGALVSQFAPDAPRTSTTFLRRNNVIAGLSDVSIVIDGQQRSGSRHQSEQAATYGRTVLFWAPTLASQAWARAAVKAGNAAFVSSIDEVRGHMEAHTEHGT